MIRSFKSKALKAFWERGQTRYLDARQLPKIKLILDALEYATVPEDLDLPGFRFHALIGDLAGRFSVTVRANWRVTFEWEDEDALRVDLEDYHG